jgi:hypothetical protein
LRARRADGDLDAFRRPFADQQVVRLASVLDNGFVYLIPGDAKAAHGHDPPTDDGDFSGPTAISTTMLPTGSETGSPASIAAATAVRSGSLTGAGLQRRIDDGALFHLRRTAGNPDDHPRPEERPAPSAVSNEVCEHRDRRVEISNDAVTQGPGGENIARRPPIIFFASLPTARTPPRSTRLATTDESRSTMPSRRTYNNVLAVPEIDAHVPREPTQ